LLRTDRVSRKGDTHLQRFFSAFPDRWRGFGLLLLRVLVAVSVIVQTIAYLQAAETLASWSIVALLLASAACLLLGFVTPVAAVLIGLTSVGFAFWNTPYPVQEIEMVVLAVVIALLGPGAFSIDALMFGRREILIPVTRRQ
jgi:uncharacterized membrane protein YphA (DoxX/SURF4 family)